MYDVFQYIMVCFSRLLNLHFFAAVTGQLAVEPVTSYPTNTFGLPIFIRHFCQSRKSILRTGVAIKRHEPFRVPVAGRKIREDQHFWQDMWDLLPPPMSSIGVS